MSRRYHRAAPKNDAQLPLFAPSISDVSPRDAQDAMELPFLSLSKQKRVKPIEYESRNGRKITVEGTPRIGIANIYDWDIIIYLVSVIRECLDDGKEVSQRIIFTPGDYLDAVRRPNTKHYQDGIGASLRRLKHTVVTTNIRMEDQEGGFKEERGFSWVNDYRVKTRMIRTSDGLKEIVEHYEVELCTWLYRAAVDKGLILSFDRDYFLLTGGYERWLYRLIRKSAGHTSWTWSLRSLYARSGEGESYKKFAYRIRQIVQDNEPPKEGDTEHKPPIPGYILSLEVENGEYNLKAKAIETRDIRARILPGETTHRRKAGSLALDYETEDAAKKICRSARLDYHSLEAEWRASTIKNGLKLENPNRAFLAYVRKAASRSTT